MDNSFVIGIFDCCREAYNEDNFPQPHGKIAITYRAMRGGTENEELKVKVEEGQNVFLIFGCPPNRGIPATSKLST